MPKIKSKFSTTLYKRSATCMVVFLLMISSVIPAAARTFDPNNIISDDDLFNPNSLTKTAIQTFLQREQSALASFTQSVEGVSLTAAEMIWKVSHLYNVNPKFILTTLEKEQALVSRTSATEKALDWATGYGCFGGTCRDKFRGFYQQIEATADTQKIYKEKASQFTFRVGKTTETIDKYNVTPENQATANLYIYTPYVGHAPELGINSQWGANKLFWRIWNRYFASQKFVDGQIITNGGDYWLIEDGEKRKFASVAVLDADYDRTKAISVSGADLAAYDDGPMIHLANKSLVRSEQSNQIYYIINDVRRPLLETSALALIDDIRGLTIAATEEQVITVPESHLEAYPIGPVISTSSVFPGGKLYKDSVGDIWYLQDGTRHLVDQTVLTVRFAGETPQSITRAAMEEYPTGDPVLLPDGTFVYVDGKYYLISDGARMRIVDETLFDRVFTGQKNNVVTISSNLLELHAAGEMIDYIDDTIQDPPEYELPTPYTPPTAQTYEGEIESISPSGLVLLQNEEKELTLLVKNNGTATWESDNVWLEIINKDGSASPFTSQTKIYPAGSVQPSGFGLFTVKLTAPVAESGILSQKYILKYDKNSPKVLQEVGKFIAVMDNGVSASVIENTIPTTINNNSRTGTITIRIKNTSSDTTWNSGKTALTIKDSRGNESPLYDANDWVNSTVAAVPINASTITPGQTGEFKFTLDPRGLKPGQYVLDMTLNLLDQSKVGLLDGSQVIRTVITVTD